MSDNKILLTYKDEDNNYQVESVWATKEGEYYRINNIPFFVSNIALNDLVKVEIDEGALYFEELIEASGHSTIQIIFFNEADVIPVCKDLEKLGCTWEGSHIKTLISVDVPINVNYFLVSEYLNKAEAENRLSYKEACLAHKH